MDPDLAQIFNFVMTIFPFIAIIVVVGVGGGLLNNWLRIKNGYPLQNSWGMHVPKARHHIFAGSVHLLNGSKAPADRRIGADGLYCVADHDDGLVRRDLTARDVYDGRIPDQQVGPLARRGRRRSGEQDREAGQRPAHQSNSLAKRRFSRLRHDAARVADHFRDPARSPCQGPVGHGFGSRRRDPLRLGEASDRGRAGGSRWACRTSGGQACPSGRYGSGAVRREYRSSASRADRRPRCC